MTTDSQVTPLVISLANTLHALANGSVAIDELKTAVFYMGHTESHVFDRNRVVVDRYVGEHRTAIEHAYDQFLEVLKQGVDEGRVAWRQPAQYSNSWEGLNDLLATNDLPPIQPLEWFEGYAYDAVERSINERALPYKLIGNP